MSLYKYVSKDRLSILENGLIRFTQPQAFNDPFEFKPHISAQLSNSFLKERVRNFNSKEDLQKQYEQLASKVKRKTSYDQFLKFMENEMVTGLSIMTKNVIPHFKKSIHNSFEKTIGILSLTESPKNLLMWAHYADSHQGFVIEFDSNHKFFDQRKSKKDDIRHIQKVEYSIERPLINLEKIEKIEKIEKTACIKDLFIKSLDWKYENEWRIINSLSDADKVIKDKTNNVYLFKIPFAAFKSILIGAKAEEKTVELIKTISNSNAELKHIKIQQLALHDSRFELIEK